MPHNASVCDSCHGRDLSEEIVRPGTLPGVLSIRRQKRGCPWCKQLTRLLRASFADHETENIPKGCSLNTRSVSHPFLTDHKATTFSMRPYRGENAPLRYLLPVQARFCNLESSKHGYLPFSRAIDPSSFDYGMINKNIKLCQSEHAMCGSSTCREFTPTRLIDCKTRVLRAAPNCQYVCLSYVWGDESTENAASNSQMLANIPQTVSDAMFVTLKLGMRYLWVDRYCIDQENREEKHDAIRNMDSIYREAFVTIIAAAGSGSEYGLPGVSRPRKATPFVNIGSHAFVAMNDPFIDMETSVWNTRGWTYQEMLFSRRRIIFTDYQVYFQCRAHQTMEQLDTTFESADLTKLITRNRPFFPTQKESFTIDDLYFRLEEYYPRTLRYETDNINAFDGVFRQLSDRTSNGRGRAHESMPGLYMTRRNPHFYGIPLWLQESEVTDNPETSVLWQSPEISDDDKVSLRFGIDLGWKVETRDMDISSTHAGVLVKPNFPSWSWASTKNWNHKHGRCRIRFSGRPDVIRETQNAYFIASVTHKSGQHMSMLDYTAQADDYILFHPWIDVVAYTSRGHLWEVDDQEYEFSGLPGADVYLDDDQDYTAREVKALYLGVSRHFSAHSWSLAWFLLLEETEQHEFRRVGLCEVCDDTSGQPLNVEGRFQCSQSKQMECPEAGIEWTREELRIV